METVIRKAINEDIPCLVAMGKHFAAYAPFNVDYSPEATEGMLKSLLATGVVFVSDCKGEVTGALLGVLHPFWYAPSSLIAVELAWWVNPDHRYSRSGPALVKAFEQWGREHGASLISVCDMCIAGEFPVGSMLARMGYRVVERTHVKEI